MQGKVMTVLGPVEPDTLGVTLTHEHLLIDLRVWCEEPEDEEQKAFVRAPVEMATLGAIRREPFGNLDNCVLDDTALAIEELRRFKTAGGGSVVDCTNNGLGRTPLALVEIAQATEISIVMGSGYYIGRSHPYDMVDRSVEIIADEIESDLMQGVADTGVRSGLIGEIGTSFKVRENEQKVLRAAARAQRRTGAPISVHLLPWQKNGVEVLDILEGEGANPHQVILCHLSPTSGDLAYHTTLAKRGAYVEYDFFGMEFYVDSVGRYTGSDAGSVTALFCEAPDRRGFFGAPAPIPRYCDEGPTHPLRRLGLRSPGQERGAHAEPQRTECRTDRHLDRGKSQARADLGRAGISPSRTGSNKGGKRWRVD